MTNREHAWRKSTRSNGNSFCVEAAATTSAVLVRDSKNPDGGMLEFAAAEWRELTDRIKGS